VVFLGKFPVLVFCANKNLAALVLNDSPSAALFHQTGINSIFVARKRNVKSSITRPQKIDRLAVRGKKIIKMEGEPG
jgi:hypothetical protein